jgi:hypothetical protein
VTACTALGWCLESRAPLAATLVMNFFVGLGGGVINLATVGAVSRQADDTLMSV